MTAEEIGSDQGTEQQALDDLLESLDAPVPGLASRRAAAPSVARELTEVLGLLAFENEPMDPSATVKRRLMGRVRGVDAAIVAAATTPRAAVRWRRGARVLPLAAGLILVLSGISGWQYRQVDRQRATIEDLAGRLSHRNIEMTDLADSYQQQLERMQDQLALVTSKGVEVCELKPQVAEVAATGARGALFVASDHQHWYLRIDDLEPCPQGRTYQLWFMLEDGTSIDGGILEVEHGVELEVTSDTMPQGATAVHVTLEPAGGSVQPSGPMVLYGDETQQIL